MFERIKSFFNYSHAAERSDQLGRRSSEKENTFECSPPSFYFIDTCNICNLKCLFCPTGNRKIGMAKAKMSKEKYKVIFDKILPYAKQIHLYNWGEPFLNEDILPIVSLTASRGIYTEIHSNLSMRDFDRIEAEEIVRSGLSLLSVSLDGASQGTYSKYRVGGNFDRVFENIKKIIEAREKIGGQISVRWNFLINTFNEHEVEDVKKIAADLGMITRFALMGIEDDSWASSFHRDHSKVLPENVVLANEGEGCHRYARLKPEPIPLHRRLPAFCQQPFDWMTVNPNGDVMPCCTVYGDRYSMGNLLEPGTLLDIWNNAMFRKSREFLRHYGQNQKTGSVCQTMPCNVRVKTFSGKGKIVCADFEILFLKGFWVESEDEEWAWLSENAILTFSGNKTGILMFDLVLPDNEMHRSVLPLSIEVLNHRDSIYSKTIKQPGNYGVEIEVESGKKHKLRIICDHSVVPDMFDGNGDTRKLSLIIRKFAIR